MGAFVGIVIGLSFGALAFWAYRARLVVQARARQPARIADEDYYIVPAQEYGNLITARDLTRAALKQLEARRHLADPYIDRRTEPRPDPANDLDVAGRPLKPGS